VRVSYFAAVSGVSTYESWVYTGFNFILGLPIIFYGIQDRDLSARFVQDNPEVSCAKYMCRRHCSLSIHK
jgi:Phospholipid-translocating P-type ATPase C-terminal